MIWKRTRTASKERIWRTKTIDNSSAGAIKIGISIQAFFCA
jgi:hypothetical protein